MWSDGSSTARAFRARRERQHLRRAIHAAGLRAPVHWDEVTESTNTTALELAAKGEPEWTLVVAGHQTGGRGRLGRTWVSEPGSSLLFSVVLRPRLDPERGLLLTLLAGVAMAEACRAVTGADVRCKWPNDLVVGERKVGGILAEARVRDGRFQHVVVGVGMNLRSAPASVEGATSLGDVDRTALLTEFLRRFRERYPPVGDDGFAHLVVNAYAPLSATLGKRVQATIGENEVVEGTALDIDPAGNLVLYTEQGRATVGFGEVVHVRAGDS
jgi:BirA family transcriptional regulator, biotin operon repressor / biotin---[acetyl-CoA-carboxylase] ligase